MRVACAFFILVLSLSALIAQPRIAVDKLEFDLGTVYAGQVMKGNFGIKNVGNQPLKIRSIQPSCGCTTVRSPKPELAPGESDNIEIEFHSEGFRGDLIKYVNIVSNDSALENLSVRFKVLVKEELEPVNHAGIIWFGSVKVGSSQDQAFEFKNTSGKTLAIQGVRSSNSAIKAAADKKSLKPGEIVKLSVKASPDRIGYANEKVYVDTNSKNQPHVTISVTYIGSKEP